MSRFRPSSHSLEVETGRYNTDKNDRLCKLCSQNTIESKYLFLLCCTRFDDLRKNTVFPRTFLLFSKFKLLLSTKRVKTIRNISKYIYRAMKLRYDLLANSAAY